MRPLRRWLIAIAAFTVLGVVLVSYVLSATSATDTNLRVILSRTEGGHRAVLQNTSLRRVVVTTCEVSSDDLSIGNESFVSDAVQRKSPDGEWRTVLKRDFCNGTTKVRLLWPRQKIYSARFYANVGFQFREGEGFQRGNTLRFVLFPNSGIQEVKVAPTELYSPEFTVD